MAGIMEEAAITIKGHTRDFDVTDILIEFARNTVCS